MTSTIAIGMNQPTHSVHTIVSPEYSYNPTSTQYQSIDLYDYNTNTNKLNDVIKSLQVKNSALEYELMILRKSKFTVSQLIQSDPHGNTSTTLYNNSTLQDKYNASEMKTIYLQNMVDEKVQCIDVLTSRLDTLSHTYDNKCVAMQQYELKHQSCESDIKQLTNTINTLNDEVNEIKHSRSVVQQRNTNLQQHNDTLQSKIYQLQQHSDIHDNTINELNNKLNELQNRYEVGQQQLQQSVADDYKSKLRSSELQKQIDSQQHTINDTQNQLLHANQQLNELQNKNTQLLQQLQQKQYDNEQTIADSNSSYTSLQQQYNQLLSSYDTLQQQYNSTQQQYNQQQNMYNNSMQRIDQLTTQSNVYTTQIQQLTDIQHELQAQITTLNGKHQHALKTSNILHDQINELQHELSRITALNTQLTVQLQQLQSQLHQQSISVPVGAAEPIGNPGESTVNDEAIPYDTGTNLNDSVESLGGGTDKDPMRHDKKLLALINDPALFSKYKIIYYELQSVKSDHNTLCARYDTLTQQHHAVQKKYDKLFARHSTVCVPLQTQLNDTQCVLDAASKQQTQLIQQLQNDNQQLQQQLHAKQLNDNSQGNDMSTQIDTLNNTIHSLQNELQVSKSKIGVLQMQAVKAATLSKRNTASNLITISDDNDKQTKNVDMNHLSTTNNNTPPSSTAIEPAVDVQSFSSTTQPSSIIPPLSSNHNLLRTQPLSNRRVTVAAGTAVMLSLTNPSATNMKHLSFQSLFGTQNKLKSTNNNITPSQSKRATIKPADTGTNHNLLNKPSQRPPHKLSVDAGDNKIKSNPVNVSKLRRASNFS